MTFFLFLKVIGLVHVWGDSMSAKLARKNRARYILRAQSAFPRPGEKLMKKPIVFFF